MKDIKHENGNDHVSVNTDGKMVNLLNQMNTELFEDKKILSNTGPTESRIYSLLNRPRKETYKTDQRESVGDILRASNYTHTAAEEKIERANRKNR